MGPTMNALVANGFGSVGERRALLHLMLNPFSQSCYEVGVVTFGETSPSLPDLRAFFSLPFGACPTLLIPGALYSDEFAQNLFVELLQSFDDGHQAWDKLRHFPGDPWKRVENEMAGLPDFIAKSLKRIETQKQPRRLAITEAREFAQLQLNPKNLDEEFKAFMFAWEGSINFSGLGLIAMSKERFPAGRRFSRRLRARGSSATRNLRPRFNWVFGDCSTWEPDHTKKSHRYSQEHPVGLSGF
jgi:hypothetical protein